MYETELNEAHPHQLIHSEEIKLTEKQPSACLKQCLREKESSSHEVVTINDITLMPHS